MKDVSLNGITGEVDMGKDHMMELVRVLNKLQENSSLKPIEQSC
jgi:hypothetical protein